MVKHCQLVYKNKYLALMTNYGLAEETLQFKGPLSFKDYLCHVLHCDFWGDEIILYAISCMWCLWISHKLPYTGGIYLPQFPLERC